MKLRKAFFEGVDVITVLDFAGDSVGKLLAPGNFENTLKDRKL